MKCESRDCDWMGELGEIQKHLKTCLFVSVKCPKSCRSDDGKLYECIRKDLDEHLKENCPYRDFECPHCNEWGSYEERTTVHLEECPMILVKCPNEGCDAEICSSLISFHMDTDCDFMAADCKYKNVGCTAPLLRKDAKEHESDNTTHLHIAMGSMALLQKEVALLKEKIQSLHEKSLKQPYSVTYRLSHFSDYKKGDKFLGDSFCIDTLYMGYQIYFQIIPDKNKHVAVFIDLINICPFTGSVEVELLNQFVDNYHYSRIISIPNERQQMDRLGYPHFISHKKLTQNYDLQVKYLLNDTLYFRVTVIPSTGKEWLSQAKGGNKHNNHGY